MVDFYTKPTKTVERLFKRSRLKRHEELKINLSEIKGYNHELSTSVIWRATRTEISTRIIGNERYPSRFYIPSPNVCIFHTLADMEFIPYETRRQKARKEKRCSKINH